jgi:hypothetical protein
VNECNVAVLGAAGTIAPAIVADLAASEEVASTVLLDLDGDRAAAVARHYGGGRATAARADARTGLGATLAAEAIDVLVNAASYRVNLDAMRACLDVGCHYLDLGGLYHVTLQQLELDARFRDAQRLALLGIGSSPGKTSVMAASAVEQLETVDSIDVAAAGRDPAAAGGLTPPYALQTLIDELTLAPIVLRDGQPVPIEPLTAGGSVDFGEPIGVAETIYTLHSELATFGPSFGCAGASFRLSLATARPCAGAAAAAAARGRRGAAAIGRDGLGAPRRGPGRRADRSRARDHASASCVRPWRLGRLDGGAGGGRGAAASAGPAAGDGRAAARALHRAGASVRRARAARLLLRDRREGRGVTRPESIA